MTTKETKNKASKQMLVRYGKLGYLGWFSHELSDIPHTPQKVVIKTERGLEIGELVGQHSYRGGHLKIKNNDLEKYYEHKTGEYPIGEGGEFVRFATAEDISEEKHINESAKRELKTCISFAKELGLEMKVVDYEHVFGGERIVFYFVSEGRIDFRELVKQLAKEFQTRIEMRQIGARDEARLISDIETCGQRCCCAQYLKILKPVNMRMAKIQKATLDPAKISGHCGRLRCCLRYEDDTYRDLKAQMPNRSTRVRTEHGEGRVVDYQILTQLLLIQYEDGKIEAVPMEECEILTDSNRKASGDSGCACKKAKSKPAPSDREKKGSQDSGRSQARPAKKSAEQTAQKAEPKKGKAPAPEGQDRTKVKPEPAQTPAKQKDQQQAGKDSEAKAKPSKDQAWKKKKRRKPRPDNQQRRGDNTNKAQGSQANPEKKSGEQQNAGQQNKDRNVSKKNKNRNRKPWNKSKNRKPGSEPQNKPKGPQDAGSSPDKNQG